MSSFPLSEDLISPFNPHFLSHPVLLTLSLFLYMAVFWFNPCSFSLYDHTASMYFSCLSFTFVFNTGVPVGEGYMTRMKKATLQHINPAFLYMCCDVYTCPQRLELVGNVATPPFDESNKLLWRPLI